MHPVTNASEAVSDSTSENGESNAASVNLGKLKTNVDVFADTSGAATLTVEVSTDGSTWRQADTVDIGSATTDFQQYHFAYPHVRAYLDTATNTVEVVGRGV